MFLYNYNKNKLGRINRQALNLYKTCKENLKRNSNLIRNEIVFMLPTFSMFRIPTHNSWLRYFNILTTFKFLVVNINEMLSEHMIANYRTA